jgi:hypothetical protein
MLTLTFRPLLPAALKNMTAMLIRVHFPVEWTKVPRLASLFNRSASEQASA